MRGYLLVPALVAPALIVAACGSFGDSSTRSSADASTEAADGPDAARIETSIAADGGEPVFGVLCGTTVCRGNDACCYHPLEKTFSCASRATICPNGGYQYFCDDREDCAALGLTGKQCCAEYEYTDGTANQSTATCATACPTATRCKPNSTECDTITIADASTSCVSAVLTVGTNATIEPRGYFECRAP